MDGPGFERVAPDAPGPGFERVAPDAPGPGFERVAHCYDETRGGEVRGDAVAAALVPYLPAGGTVLEVGVGTGVVALGLRRRGHDVVGVDVAPSMLARAHERLGPSLARADATRLPLPRQSVSTALFVWVLQLVDDAAAALAEAARVVRPGGRVVVVPSGPIRHDEPGLLVQGMHRRLGLRPGSRADHVETAGRACGLLRHVATDLAIHEPFELVPGREADLLEARAYSSLWDVDEATFDRVVRPTVTALRALPAPAEPRLVESHQHVVVFERR